MILFVYVCHFADPYTQYNNEVTSSDVWTTELDHSCSGNFSFSKLINMMTRMRWKVIVLVKDGIQSRIQVWDRELLGYVHEKDAVVEE